ncbi:MAG: hypothetical protein KGJ86_17230, partial [Chloroflexota bacterium]|nr:hypothetical protein [Chloroflexota bacterium]
RLTPKGVADTSIPWVYITQAPPTLFKAGAPEYPKIIQDGERAMLASGIADPTVGYYSPTDSGKGTSLTHKMIDAFNDIVSGRRSLSDYDQLVKDWRSAGGDKIRTEYQEAIAASK